MAPVSDSYSSTLTQGLLTRLITAIALGYSGAWNARRLENPFYAFWNIVFAEWISDLQPYALLMPQYQIDTIKQTPGPDDSMGTITRQGAKEIIPDFVIATVHLISRATNSAIPPTPFPLHFSSWRDVRISRLEIRFLAELKRPAPRGLESQDPFLYYLYSLLSAAREQLLEQAKHVFIKYPYTDQIVAIACAGEWWSWKMVTRTDLMPRNESILDGTIRGGKMLPPHNTPRSGNTTLPTDNAPLASISRTTQAGPSAPATSMESGQRHRLAQVPSQPYTTSPSPEPDPDDLVPFNPGRRMTAAERETANREKIEQARVRNFHRHDVLPPDLQEQPGGDEQVILAQSHIDWSRYLLFGTEASNEHFSLLHRVLEGQMPPMSYPSQDSEMDIDAESDFEVQWDSDSELADIGSDLGWDEAGNVEAVDDEVVDGGAVYGEAVYGEAVYGEAVDNEASNGDLEVVDVNPNEEAALEATWHRAVWGWTDAGEGIDIVMSNNL